MDLVILKRHLKSLDSDFDSLLYFTKYTTIYLLSDGEWKDLNIYGTFVIYSRNNKNLRIRIFNKINKEDKYLEMSDKTKIRINNKILKIYNEETYGIWFHDEKNLNQVYEILTIHI
ncbi:mRNA-decapping enzyme [Vairimorpha necatrix]|uniref:mRNA-decapping enzyme n=1 Tax=Vairimorpha necatrix TaxID=6039 RepID=A0AAX4J8H2_9MICR